MPLYARCLDCAINYETQDTKDYGLCPACQVREDRMYAAEPALDYDRSGLRPWSRVAMRERLGVIADRDE